MRREEKQQQQWANLEGKITTTTMGKVTKIRAATMRGGDTMIKQSRNSAEGGMRRRAQMTWRKEETR